MLQSIDSFGLPFKMTFDKKPAFKSATGGVFTIVLIFVALVCIWLLGKEIINREQPRIVVTSAKFPNRLHLNMSLPMAFILQTKRGQSIPDLDKYINVELRYYNSTWDPKTKLAITSHPMKITKCKKEFFDQRIGDAFDFNLLQNGWCLDKANLLVEGFYTLPFVSYYELEVSECVNTTLKQNLCYQRNLFNRRSVQMINRFLFTINQSTSPL